MKLTKITIPGKKLDIAKKSLVLAICSVLTFGDIAVNAAGVVSDSKRDPSKYDVNFYDEARQNLFLNGKSLLYKGMSESRILTKPYAYKLYLLSGLEAYFGTLQFGHDENLMYANPDATLAHNIPAYEKGLEFLRRESLRFIEGNKSNELFKSLPDSRQKEIYNIYVEETANYIVSVADTNRQLIDDYVKYLSEKGLLEGKNYLKPDINGGALAYGNIMLDRQESNIRILNKLLNSKFPNAKRRIETLSNEHLSGLENLKRIVMNGSKDKVLSKAYADVVCKDAAKGSGMSVVDLKSNPIGGQELIYKVMKGEYINIVAKSDGTSAIMPNMKKINALKISDKETIYAGLSELASGGNKKLKVMLGKVLAMAKNGKGLPEDLVIATDNNKEVTVTFRGMDKNGNTNQFVAYTASVPYAAEKKLVTSNFGGARCQAVRTVTIRPKGNMPAMRVVKNLNKDKAVSEQYITADGKTVKLREVMDHNFLTGAVTAKSYYEMMDAKGKIVDKKNIKDTTLAGNHIFLVTDVWNGFGDANSFIDWGTGAYKYACGFLAGDEGLKRSAKADFFYSPIVVKYNIANTPGGAAAYYKSLTDRGIYAEDATSNVAAKMEGSFWKYPASLGYFMGNLSAWFAAFSFMPKQPGTLWKPYQISETLETYLENTAKLKATAANGIKGVKNAAVKLRNTVAEKIRNIVYNPNRINGDLFTWLRRRKLGRQLEGVRLNHVVPRTYPFPNSSVETIKDAYVTHLEHLKDSNTALSREFVEQIDDTIRFIKDRAMQANKGNISPAEAKALMQNSYRRLADNFKIVRLNPAEILPRAPKNLNVKQTAVFYKEQLNKLMRQGKVTQAEYNRCVARLDNLNNLYTEHSTHNLLYGNADEVMGKMYETAKNTASVGLGTQTLDDLASHYIGQLRMAVGPDGSYVVDAAINQIKAAKHTYANNPAKARTVIQQVYDDAMRDIKPNPKNFGQDFHQLVTPVQVLTPKDIVETVDDIVYTPVVLTPDDIVTVVKNGPVRPVNPSEFTNGGINPTSGKPKKPTISAMENSPFPGDLVVKPGTTASFNLETATPQQAATYYADKIYGLKYYNFDVALENVTTINTIAKSGRPDYLNRMKDVFDSFETMCRRTLKAEVRPFANGGINPTSGKPQKPTTSAMENSPFPGDLVIKSGAENLSPGAIKKINGAAANAKAKIDTLGLPKETAETFKKSIDGWVLYGGKLPKNSKVTADVIVGKIKGVTAEAAQYMKIFPDSPFNLKNIIFRKKGLNTHPQGYAINRYLDEMITARMAKQPLKLGGNAVPKRILKDLKTLRFEDDIVYIKWKGEEVNLTRASGVIVYEDSATTLIMYRMDPSLVKPKFFNKVKQYYRKYVDSLYRSGYETGNLYKDLNSRQLFNSSPKVYSDTMYSGIKRVLDNKVRSTRIPTRFQPWQSVKAKQFMMNLDGYIGMYTSEPAKARIFINLRELFKKYSAEMNTKEVFSCFSRTVNAIHDNMHLIRASRFDEFARVIESIGRCEFDASRLISELNSLVDKALGHGMVNTANLGCSISGVSYEGIISAKAAKAPKKLTTSAFPYQPTKSLIFETPNSKPAAGKPVVSSKPTAKFDPSQTAYRYNGTSQKLIGSQKLSSMQESVTNWAMDLPISNGTKRAFVDYLLRLEKSEALNLRDLFSTMARREINSVGVELELFLRRSTAASNGKQFLSQAARDKFFNRLGEFGENIPKTKSEFKTFAEKLKNLRYDAYKEIGYVPTAEYAGPYNIESFGVVKGGYDYATEPIRFYRHQVKSSKK